MEHQSFVPVPTGCHVNRVTIGILMIVLRGGHLKC